MSRWGSARARRVLIALERIGWKIKRTSGSHRTLSRDGYPDFVFAFHDKEEIGPRMLARIAKRTGLTPDDLDTRVLRDRVCRARHQPVTMGLLPAASSSALSFSAAASAASGLSKRMSSNMISGLARSAASWPTHHSSSGLVQTTT